MKLKKWIVYTPEYGTVEPVLDFGQGPIEMGADVIEIEASTCRDAITLGVKEMLRLNRDSYGNHYQWCADNRSENLSPFAGVKAERV
jgi:hypothetical protein